MTTADRVQLAKLAQRIPGQYVEQVDVGRGRKEAYIPHEVVNQFLLYVLGPFDFEVVELIRGDVAEVPPNPQGQSDRAKAGTPPLRGVVVGARCQLTATIDDETTRITEIGDVEDPHNWSNDGKRAKAAASDGLKRCAMRFGFGLELRAGDQYVLDKWLPIPSKDGQSETSGAGRGGPAPDSASEPAGTSDSEGVPGGAAGGGGGSGCHRPGSPGRGGRGHYQRPFRRSGHEHGTAGRSARPQPQQLLDPPPQGRPGRRDVRAVHRPGRRQGAQGPSG